MIHPVLKEIEQLLPLNINKATWGGEVLSLVGAAWNFNAICAWRVVKSRCMLYGCYDKHAEDRIMALSDSKIIRVVVQSTSTPVDPVFELSTGVSLEIFSTDTFEPWTIRLPTGQIYVASPSDADAFSG